MFESILLGAVQGIVEWLPVSSEGVLVLLQVNLFGQSSAVEAIKLALFLHLGTFLAALVYFWRDVKRLLRQLFSYQKLDTPARAELNLYLIATVVSGVVAGGLLQLIKTADTTWLMSGKIITIAIGILLLVTAALQFSRCRKGLRDLGQSNRNDALQLGLLQGLAALPGVSRSGSTTAIMILRNFTEESSLRASFIVSLPIVLLGNIILNADKFTLSVEMLVALLSSFTFGILTIHGLLRIAKKVNFGWFVLVFAVITLVAGLLS